MTRPTLLATALLGLAWGAQAQEAAPLALKFMPPKVPAQPVCSAPETELNSLSDLRRQITSMARIGSGDGFETVRSSIDRLEQSSSSYAQIDALHDRIRLYLAAGRVAELEARGDAVDFVAQVQASPEISARFRHSAARLLMAGTGLPADEQAGLELLISSAFDGYHEALIDVAVRQVSGLPVPGWTTSPEIALTLAFGAFVGALDPGVCARAARIASFYRNGEVVEKDPEIALAWLQFASDLGDPVAAWRIAQLHLDAVEIPKDNRVLIEQLERAVAGGLPYAQMQYAELLAAGALVDQDLPRARALFEAAAQDMPRLAKTRLLRLRDTHPQAFADPLAAEEALLRDLITFEAAQGWASYRLYALLQQRTGRWQDLAEKEALLRAAVAGGSAAAGRALAEFTLASARSDAPFLDAISLYAEAAMEGGDVNSLQAIADAYMCRNPAGPDPMAAAAWARLRNDASGRTVTYDATELLHTPWRADPALFATIQAQAVMGRAGAIETLLQATKDQDQSPQSLAFWRGRSEDRDSLETLRLRLFMAAATGPAQQRHALARARGELDLDQPRVGLAFAAAALETKAFEADPAFLRRLIEPQAERGSGTALRLLVRLEPGPRPAASVFTRYGAAIARSGDADALIFALPFVDRATQDLYIARATASLICQFTTAAEFARQLIAIGRAPLALRWITTVEALSTGRGWEHLEVGDLYAALPGHESAALAAYARARDLGMRAGYFRATDLMLGQSAPGSDPQAFADLLLEMITREEDGDLVAVGLSRLGKAPREVQDRVRGRFDRRAALAAAAAARVPRAMREYGRLLRQGEVSSARLAEAALWTRRAAEAGDPAAMMDYAELLAFGFGLAADPDQARLWLQRAADGGHKKARGLQANIQQGEAE